MFKQRLSIMVPLLWIPHLTNMLAQIPMIRYSYQAIKTTKIVLMASRHQLIRPIQDVVKQPTGQGRGAPPMNVIIIIMLAVTGLVPLLATTLTMRGTSIAMAPMTSGSSIAPVSPSALLLLSRLHS